MATSSRLTKTALLAKIDALEAELNALYYAQRPSRTAMGSIAANDDGSRTRYWRDRSGNEFATTVVYEGQRQVSRTRAAH